MLPFNDPEPNRYSRIPIITLGLIFFNTLFLIFELFWLSEDPYFFYRYGSTPAIILSGAGPAALATITHMFLHGGPGHLIGNMTALWVFGRRVEDACGPARFLLFYLLCGVCADILSTVVRAMSSPNIPGIGASGAVFGVMGAYLVLFPEGRIRTLILFWMVPTWPRIRAIWVVLYFLGVQVLPAFATLAKGANYEVNYWAHIGGFLGALFIHLFLRPEAFSRYMSDVPV